MLLLLAIPRKKEIGGRTPSENAPVISSAGTLLSMRPRPSKNLNSLDVLYAQAAEAARKGSQGFSFATRFFPVDLRRAAHAVYWFCYYTRRLASQAENPEQARADLDRWGWDGRGRAPRGAGAASGAGYFSRHR